MSTTALLGSARERSRPTSSRELTRSQGYNIVIGAFATLASYALFHLITVVFPGCRGSALYSTSPSPSSWSSR